MPISHFGGPLGPDREDRHLTVVGLLEQDAGLDRVLVDLVDDGVDRLAVERVVGRVQLALGRGVGHLLDQHHYVHCLGFHPS